MAFALIVTNILNNMENVYFKGKEEFLVANTYQLIAIRYKEKEDSNLIRREFHPKDELKARLFYDELNDMNFVFVEARDIEVEYGGGETMKELHKWNF